MAYPVVLLFIFLYICCETFGQLAVPEQVHLSLANEPNAMTVTWVTMASCKVKNFHIRLKTCGESELDIFEEKNASKIQ